MPHEQESTLLINYLRQIKWAQLGSIIGGSNIVPQQACSFIQQGRFTK